jgi:sugar phosphate isomerase/epimerase
MKRREFINLSVAATGLASFGITEFYPTGKKSTNIPVGAHVWVYANTQPGYDVTPVLDQIFSDMKYAGLDGVELMEAPLRKPETVKTIGELIDRYRLPLIGTSYSANMWDASRHNEIIEDVENIMDHLTSLKARTFGTSVGSPPGGRLKTEKELDAQAVLLEKLIAMGKKKGVVLNLHNHTKEVENNMHDLGGTLKRIPDVKLGPDLNWLLRAGIDPITFLMKYKKNIVFIHLRDQLENGKWPESVGEGNQDFRKIGETLRSINFKGDIIIELAHENNFVPVRPIRESLKMSRDYVRKTTGY